MPSKFEVAQVQLIMRHPFFGSLLLRHPKVMTDKVPTMAVDVNGRIYVNPKFCEELDVQEIVFVLAHEAMHAALAHAARMQNRDREAWNIATDAVINALLRKEGVGVMPRGGVDIPGSETKSAEEVYESLSRQGRGGGGGGESDAPSLDPSQADLLEGETGMTKEEIAQAVAQSKIEISQAMHGARMAGKLGSATAKLLEEYVKSKVDWKAALEMYLTSKASMHTTWKRPNKRMLRVAYMPKHERLPSMGRVVIGIDVSGSVTEDELKKIFGHVNRILEQVRPSEVAVLYVDTKVEHVDKYTREDLPVEVKMMDYCGGTDMCEVTRWIEDEDYDPDLCVIFTDGCTPVPDETPCPVVWAVTDKERAEKGDFPGEVIYVDVSEE